MNVCLYCTNIPTDPISSHRGSVQINHSIYTLHMHSLTTSQYVITYTFTHIRSLILYCTNILTDPTNNHGGSVQINHSIAGVATTHPRGHSSKPGIACCCYRILQMITYTSDIACCCYRIVLHSVV